MATKRSCTQTVTKCVILQADPSLLKPVWVYLLAGFKKLDLFDHLQNIGPSCRKSSFQLMIREAQKRRLSFGVNFLKPLLHSLYHLNLGIEISFYYSSLSNGSFNFKYLPCGCPV